MTSGAGMGIVRTIADGDKSQNKVTIPWEEIKIEVSDEDRSNAVRGVSNIISVWIIMKVMNPPGLHQWNAVTLGNQNPIVQSGIRTWDLVVQRQGTLTTRPSRRPCTE